MALVVYGCRLVIPSSLQKQVLSDLHASHQGRLRTKQRAKLIVYLPGEINNFILSCTMCQDGLPSNPPEPIIQKARPTRPFQEIAVDFCSHAGRDFLVLVVLDTTEYTVTLCACVLRVKVNTIF